MKLSNSGYVDNDLFISEEHYQSLKQSYGVPQAGDLMVTGVGTIGKVYIVKKDDLFYYKDASVLCFENRYGIILSEYARIMIDSPLLQNQIHSKTYGNTVDTITISTANEYICILPPIKEQLKIINTVNSSIELIAAIEHNKSELSDIIVQAKSKILDLAIRGKLVPQNPDDEPASVLLERIRAEKEELIKAGKIKRDKKESVIFKGEDNSYYEKIEGEITNIAEEIPFSVPENWCWCRLNTLCTKEIKRGKAPKYSDKSNTLVFAQKCNTKKGNINISLAQYLDENVLKKYQPEFFMKYNDIVINSTGTGTLGRVGIFEKSDDIYGLPIVPDSHITTIRVSELIVAKYIYALLKLKQPYFETVGEGSTNQKELRPEALSDILIPLPPVLEQKQIVATINSICIKLDKIEQSLN